MIDAKLLDCVVLVEWDSNSVCLLQNNYRLFLGFDGILSNFVVPTCVVLKAHNYTFSLNLIVYLRSNSNIGWKEQFNFFNMQKFSVRNSRYGIYTGPNLVQIHLVASLTDTHPCDQRTQWGAEKSRSTIRQSTQGWQSNTNFTKNNGKSGKWSTSVRKMEGNSATHTLYD